MAKKHLYCNVCGRKTKSLFVDAVTKAPDAQTKQDFRGGNSDLAINHFWVCGKCFVDREEYWYRNIRPKRKNRTELLDGLDRCWGPGLY